MIGKLKPMVTKGKGAKAAKPRVGMKVTGKMTVKRPAAASGKKSPPKRPAY